MVKSYNEYINESNDYSDGWIGVDSWIRENNWL